MPKTSNGGNADNLSVPESTLGWPIWGHDHAVRELQAAVVRGPRHAYILSGFRHAGKRALALAFARAIVCEQPPTPGLACGQCKSCRRVDRGTHPDVSTWNLERQQATSEKSSTGKNLSLTIQTVREIISAVSLRPVESSQRIIIVDDVETMQETAQEAFLKTLEEPPAYATIILLTTDAELLLETIRSRAMTIQLQSVPTHTIVDMLVAAGVDDERAATIADAAMGLPGWALKAASDDSVLRKELEVREAVVSWIHGDDYRRMVEATRLGDQFAKDREAVFDRLTAAHAIWRSAALTAIGADEASRTTAQRDAIVASAGEAVKAVKSVSTCMRDLDANVRPRLALQAMVLQWPSLER